MEKSYTAVQPLAQQARLLTGQSAEQTVWHVLGRTFGGAENTEEKEAGAPEDGALCQTIWEPLHLGHIALPAAVCRTSYWMTDTRTLNYTPETAAAMAKRACRRQLLQEFPGAQLEQRERRNRTDASRVCNARCGIRSVRTLRSPARCTRLRRTRRLTLAVQTKNGARHLGGRRSVKKSWFGQVLFHISLQPVKKFRG